MILPSHGLCPGGPATLDRQTLAQLQTLRASRTTGASRVSLCFHETYGLVPDRPPCQSRTRMPAIHDAGLWLTCKGLTALTLGTALNRNLA